MALMALTPPTAQPLRTSNLFLALCLGLLAAAGAQAQAAPPPADPAAERSRLLQEINRDIWIPFSKAFATDDAEGYLKLHSRDFIRGEGNAKRVLRLPEFADGVRRSFAQRKERGGKVEIQFRFLERLANGDAASERGIFRFTAFDRDGVPTHFYGKFHVVERKEDGAWRLLFDYDSNEGGTIDEDDWNAAAALDDFGKG